MENEIEYIDKPTGKIECPWDLPEGYKHLDFFEEALNESSYNIRKSLTKKLIKRYKKLSLKQIKLQRQLSEIITEMKIIEKGQLYKNMNSMYGNYKQALKNNINELLQ